jgi:porphobilinogen synthase
MAMPGDFPHVRPRRLRRSALLRDLAADVTLAPANLVLPMFVGEMPEPTAVASMPGVLQWPVAAAVDHIAMLATRGLRAFMLFGVTPRQRKDAAGSHAAAADCPVNRTLTLVRQRGLDVVMMADTCLCEYTDHGHCGPLASPAPIEKRQSKMPEVDNDATLTILAATAVAQAKAGADVVAPSGMMDGQVGAIRAALDGAGFLDTAILSYSVKFASHFYGPFRDAGQGHLQCGDRRGYQMDFRRSREWRTELEQDLRQGADVVMVKPAAHYLDIVRLVRDACSVPVAAYHVSGEYAMLQAAAERGWIDLRSAALETTYAIRRAGADWVLTYFAEALLEWM